MGMFDESYAQEQDSKDGLKHLRDQFIIPTRAQLKRKTITKDVQISEKGDDEPSTYLCGNSLGLQPKLTAKYTVAYHETWATKGVFGHFTEIEDSPLAPWLHVDDNVTTDMAAIVGAERNEVSMMQTLTANLHFAMSTFYRPSKERYKIIIESKAFPSDHYAIESQILHHDLDPTDAMITIEPPTPDKPTLTTEHILSVIDKHAADTAVLLLPGVQFYTGQFFDIETITAHAQKYGIAVGWDLAHAVGNVPLSLHSHNVDFAVWCSYKYLNCGPGSIGGLFIHSRHSQVSEPSTSGGRLGYKPRLSGWWGSSKTSRFAMSNSFEPIPGAAGWQLSNPSVADLTAVRASLDVYKQTSMEALRERSLRLTGYLQELLEKVLDNDDDEEDDKKDTNTNDRVFEIITPLDPAQRGAQLSVKLQPGLLDSVMKTLEEEGVVVDERRPDVIRVAPAPLYNSFADVWRFVKVFRQACVEARRGLGDGDGDGEGEGKGSVMVEGGKSDKGWSEVK